MKHGATQTNRHENITPHRFNPNILSTNASTYRYIVVVVVRGNGWRSGLVGR